MKFEWAPQAFRALNGIFCVQKPSSVHIAQVMEILKFKLAEDLNKLPCYKYERKLAQSSSGIRSRDTTLPVPTDVPAEIRDLSDHRLVLGPRYIPSDIRLFAVPSRLSKHSSGVQILGLGKGIRDANMIRDCRYIRVYHVTGQFGMATGNFTTHGKIIQRTTYHHVKKTMVDKVCASTQASHARLAFDFARIDPHSQDAYEMASRGIIRPTTGQTPPLVYGVKCIDFNIPHFTLEIHTINENAAFFKNLIHEIGLSVRSTAVCSKILRIRYGHFTLQHALLRKHWTLEHILENIKFCRSNLEFDKLLPGQFITDDRKYLPEEKQSPDLYLEEGEMSSGS